jgi:transposase
VAKRRRRRNWDDEEKRMICAQTRVPGVSVSQVARRYNVNANQVFNWLREPRFADAELREPECWATTEPAFLPVEITKQQDMTVANGGADPVTLEIDLACGHRLLVTGAYDADALVRLIRGLSS